MSDYLNNLAAKNLNPTEEVRPRPMSLFEQLPAAGGPGFDQYSGPEMIGSEPVPGETELDTPSLPRQTLVDLLMTLSVPNQETHPRNEQQSEELSAISEAHPKRSHDHPSPPGILTASQPVGRSSSEQLAGAKVGSSFGDPKLQRKQATRQQSITGLAVDSQPVEKRNVQLVDIKTEQQRTDGLSITPKQHSEELTKTQTTGHLMLEQSRKTRVSQPLAEPASQQKQIRGQQPLPSRVVIPQPKEVFSPDVPETRRRPAFEPLIREVVTERIISAEKPPSAEATSTETEVIPTSNLKPQTTSEQESPHPEPSLTPETSGRIAAQPHVRKHVEPPMPRPITIKGTQKEPMPTIQVTIGRVEVRAMPPQAPPAKKQRSKPPVMSLDEYLGQRAKGGSI